MPDGTFSRVEFSPWHVTSYDANDTVLDSQWYRDRRPTDNRDAPEPTDPDARAAWLAAVHSNTPAQTHLDSLGREVVAIAHNRVEATAGALFAGRHWTDEKYRTFTRLDAEGKPLWIRDARDNLVMQYIVPAKANNDASDAPPSDRVPGYDIAGNLLFQHSMDAGDRWMLSDAAGKPMLAWDRNGSQADAGVSEDRLYVTDYDALHRPTHQWLYVDDKPAVMVQRFEYQDGVSNDTDNLNGQLVRHYDPSGLSETVGRDFKGNLLTVRRTLVDNKTASLTDWQTLANTDGSAKLNDEPFTRTTAYDALNRMTLTYNWHRGDGSRVAVYEPHYNRRGLLDGESLTVGATKTANGVELGSGKPTQAIVGIRYNAKGQKELLKLGKDVETTYAYDPNTFRLTNIRTVRPVPAGDACSGAFNDAVVIQDLRYTYDPVGNISQIFDAAQATRFGDNQRIDPLNRYEYDPLYRLTLATGRENRGAGPPPLAESPSPAFDCPAPDPARLQNYSQAYIYDAVGNIRRMRHVSDASPWTRDYAYAFDDPTQPASNRLWQTWMSDDRGTAVTYQHDTHGNMLNLASTDPRYYTHWDHRDMIASIDLGGGGIASYQYDSGKQRSRKYVVNQNGKGGAWERIALGGYELYRRTNGGGAVVEEIETLHLMVGDKRVLLVDDVIIAVKKQTLFRYQYGNHLGSVCLELDDTAQIISYEEFHPYGTSACRAVKSGIEAPPNRYHYTGMERDEESGLSYHHNRFYNLLLARWNSVDPILDDIPYSRYSYTRANPITATDKSGQAALPQGTTPQSLLQDAQDALSQKRLTHLDRGTSQAVLIESQGSGVADASYHNAYIHHIDDIERDIKSARTTVSQIDTVLGDKRTTIKSSLRQQLIAAKEELAARAAISQEAVDASKILDADYSSRLSGRQLPQGRVVQDSLTVMGQQRGEALTLLPDDPRFAGLAEQINKLPVRPGQSAAPLGALKPPTPPPTPAPVAGEPTPNLPVDPLPNVGNAAEAAAEFTAPVSEEVAMGLEAAQQAAKVEQAIGITFLALNVAVSGGLAIKHWNEGKQFRAVLDAASVTGAPFSIIPDVLNVGIGMANETFNFMALSEGAGVGVQSIWTSLVIDPRDYGRVSF
jgi:RHS repeat-associated protein